MSTTTTRSSASPSTSVSWSDACRSKRVDPAHLTSWADTQRVQGHTIATLNGSFDLLHAGHLQIIFEASQQADLLLLALNTDASIKGYKGPTRPLIALEERLQMVSALSFVDYVTYFDEPNPICLLEQVRPDVHVNGSEYGHTCLEAPTVRKHGGRIHIVPILPGLSTSNLIKKIQCA